MIHRRRRPSTPDRHRRWCRRKRAPQNTHTHTRHPPTHPCKPQIAKAQSRSSVSQRFRSRLLTTLLTSRGATSCCSWTPRPPHCRQKARGRNSSLSGWAKRRPPQQQTTHNAHANTGTPTHTHTHRHADRVHMHTTHTFHTHATPTSIPPVCRTCGAGQLGRPRPFARPRRCQSGSARAQLRRSPGAAWRRPRPGSTARTSPTAQKPTPLGPTKDGQTTDAVVRVGSASERVRANVSGWMGK